MRAELAARNADADAENLEKKLGKRVSSRHRNRPVAPPGSSRRVRRGRRGRLQAEHPGGIAGRHLAHALRGRDEAAGKRRRDAHRRRRRRRIRERGGVRGRVTDRRRRRRGGMGRPATRGGGDRVASLGVARSVEKRDGVLSARRRRRPRRQPRIRGLGGVRPRRRARRDRGDSGGAVAGSVPQAAWMGVRRVRRGRTGGVRTSSASRWRRRATALEEELLSLERRAAFVAGRRPTRAPRSRTRSRAWRVETCRRRRRVFSYFYCDREEKKVATAPPGITTVGGTVTIAGHHSTRMLTISRYSRRMKNVVSSGDATHRIEHASRTRLSLPVLVNRSPT